MRARILSFALAAMIASPSFAQSTQDATTPPATEATAPATPAADAPPAATSPAADATQSAATPRIAVGEVTVAAGVNATPQCRLVRRIDPTRGLTMPVFLKDALIQDLMTSGRYAEDGSVVLSAVLTDVRMTTSGSQPSWVLTMHVSSNLSPGYDVSVSTRMQSRFVAPAACNAAEEAFPAALRALLDATFNHPQFGALLAAP